APVPAPSAIAARSVQVRAAVAQTPSPGFASAASPLLSTTKVGPAARAAEGASAAVTAAAASAAMVVARRRISVHRRRDAGGVVRRSRIGTRPGVDVVATTVTTTEPPAAIVPRSQVTRLPTRSHVPCGVAADLNVSWWPSVCVRTVPTDSSGPRSLTVIVYVRSLPAGTGWGLAVSPAPRSASDSLAVTQFENSDVLPLPSVAVAVIVLLFFNGTPATEKS